MEAQVRTLKDLELYRLKNPKIIDHYAKQVTVLEDLNKYLFWLDQNEVTTDLSVALKRTKQRALGIHPSSACKADVCLLKLYLECTGKMQPNKAFKQQMQLTWDLGTMLHVMLQTWFKEMYGDQFTPEVPLIQGPIKSSTDGLFDFTHYRFIFELKSIKEGGNFGWDKIQAKPFEDNVRQCHFYMKLADVPFALLVYFGKNISEIKEHVVVFNPAIWHDIESKVIAPVMQATKAGIMPKATSGWHCNWCDFARSCPKKGAVPYDPAADWPET